VLFRSILNLGLARIESDADYEGPGAEFSRALFDGIAFNWDAVTLTRGGAARVDWKAPVDDRLELTLVGRYDLRWIDTLQEDDDAQDFSSRAQVLTFRGDLVGPTGLTMLGGPIDWRATAGYRSFLEGDLLGVRQFLQIGGALELDTSNSLPVCERLSLSAAVILGREVKGWALGIGFSF